MNYRFLHRLGFSVLAAAILALGSYLSTNALFAAAAKGAKGKKPAAEAAPAEMAPAVDVEKLRLPDDPPDAELTIDDDFNVDQVVTPKMVVALTAKPPANARRKKIAARQGLADPVMDMPVAK